MHSNNISKALVSGLLALLFTLPASAANLAGNTVFVSGKVTATDAAGSVRTLKASDKIFSGDTLETHKGRVQIKFLDGAFMSVQPNSQFQIEDYNYANKSDGSEKAVYNLFKGGMRAFTGAIGKQHPDAYKVKTPVATIGIRGTGHNTRVCNGDCVGTDGLPLPDGLYHSTWEGTTFVTNDFGTSTVPFGSAVYVESVESEPEETTEASQVTAVQPSQDAAEELVEENQEQVSLEAGEQVNSDGTPDDLPDAPNTFPATTETGQNLVSVEPDTESVDGVDIGLVFETTTFIGSDGPVGALGTDINEGEPFSESLATIDPMSILASTSPDAADAQAMISDAMANPDNDELFDTFFENPATIAEFTEASGIGFGRWTSGNVLLFLEDGSVSLTELTGDESLHFIFGDTPAVAATNASGTYEFVGSTPSSGSIGDGVTGGQLTFNFEAMTGTIAMTVSHGIIYTIEGDLLIDVVFPALFAGDSLMATTVEPNCSGEGGCIAFVEGSFFGNLGNRGGPSGAGLEYDIQDELAGEVIKGVAAFNNVTAAAPTMVQNQTLLAIAPIGNPDEFDNENAGEGQFLGSTVLVGDDSAGTNGMVGSIGRESDDNFEVVEEFDVLLTIDPLGVLAVEAPDANVTIGQGFITDALAAGGNAAAAVNAVIENPAILAEYREGTFGGADYALARWTDGNFLIAEENIDTEERFVEFDQLNDDQSAHFLFAAPAEAVTLGVGVTGTYDLVDATAPSLNNGGPNGIVQNGTLAFDFNTLNGTIDMDVLYDADLYLVNGDLKIAFDTPGEFFDTDVNTTGGLCDPSCPTIVDGTFFGPLAGTGVDGAPVLAGINYEIMLEPFDGELLLPGDSIIGNALFGRSGTADPIPDPITGLIMVQDQAILGVETNLFRGFNDDDNADGGSIHTVTALTGLDSTGTNGLAAAFGEEDDDSDMAGPSTLDLLITIDPNGVLAVVAPDANIAKAQGFITDAMDGGANEALVDSVIADPATVAEHTDGTYQGTNYSFGRWNDGKILFIDKTTSGPGTGLPQTAEVDDLGINDHFHYLFGDTANTDFGVGATGFYTFLSGAGTSSTDTHNGFVGNGIQSGELLFDFTSLNGRLIELVILHDDTYTVDGDLIINGIRPNQFYDADNRVTAVTTGTGSTCEFGCNTYIEGTFFGDIFDPGLPGEYGPEVAGLEYEIVTEPFDGETGNSIIGNGVFGNQGTGIEIPYRITANQNMVVVLPNPTLPPPPMEDFADIGILASVSTVVGADSMGTSGLLTFAGTEFNDEFEVPVPLFVVASIDPVGLGNIPTTDPNLPPPDLNIVAAQALLAAAMDGGVNEALVDSVIDTPAKLAEFFQGDGFAFGRWADGNVLFLDESSNVEVDTLVNNQSFNFLYANAPELPGLGATGSYEFAGSATASTSVDGASIGAGVTEGQLIFNFTALSGSIDMTVSHLTDYNVTGALTIDGTNGTFFDEFNSVSATGGACGGGCATFIDGGFGGELSGGAQASPIFAGLEYEIDLGNISGGSPGDGIIGVAGFNRVGDAPPL